MPSKTDAGRVVGWWCPDSKETVETQEPEFSHVLDGYCCPGVNPHDPLILAHDEAGWLERYAYNIEQVANKGEMIIADSLRAHAKMLRGLK